MSGKCISHFKMLSSVSRTTTGKLHCQVPFFLLFLFYVLKENSRVILSLLLGFRLVWASCSMSYQAIIVSYSCWTTVWTTVCRCPIPYFFVFPCFRRRWLFGRIIFTCFYSKLNDPSITQSHSWGNWSTGCCRSTWSRPTSLGLFARRQRWGRTYWGAKDTVGRTIHCLCI